MQTNISREEINSVFAPFTAEAEKHYDWCDVSNDGVITANHRTSLIRYGCYSTYSVETVFKMLFTMADVINDDGIKCWPLTSEWKCLENPEVITRLADRLGLKPGAKCAIYRGKYFGCGRGFGAHNSSQIQFVVDNLSPTHLLFVSDVNLRSTGNIFNADVIICHDFNALALPMRTVRYLMGREFGF